MHIWVDADACPNPIKEILFRAADRLKISMTLVANQPIRIPPSPFIKMIQVLKGFDIADNKIAESVSQGDLVITADIPLAADVLKRHGHVLDPRGVFYTQDTINERLNIRDFMSQLRESGIETGGPSTFSHSDRKNFASQLDRFLMKHRNS